MFFKGVGKQIRGRVRSCRDRSGGVSFVMQGRVGVSSCCGARRGALAMQCKSEVQDEGEDKGCFFVMHGSRRELLVEQH